MNSAQICAFQCAKIKRCFEIVFNHLTIFGLKNVKFNFFKKISVLSVVQSPWESQNLLTQVTMLLDIFSYILLHFSVNGKRIE